MANRKKNYNTGQCSIEGCGRNPQSRGWCEKHYRRWQHHGSPDIVKPYGGVKSKHEVQCKGCGKPATFAKLEMCNVCHYRYKFFGAGSVEYYCAQFQKQDGLCAICRKPPSMKRGLSLDHNHVTKQWRGLLCTACNFAIEAFEAGDWSRKALLYLIKYRNDEGWSSHDFILHRGTLGGKRNSEINKG